METTEKNLRFEKTLWESTMSWFSEKKRKYGMEYTVSDILTRYESALHGAEKRGEI